MPEKTVPARAQDKVPLSSEETRSQEAIYHAACRRV